MIACVVVHTDLLCSSAIAWHLHLYVNKYYLLCTSLLHDAFTLCVCLIIAFYELNLDGTDYITTNNFPFKIQSFPHAEIQMLANSLMTQQRRYIPM